MARGDSVGKGLSQNPRQVCLITGKKLNKLWYSYLAVYSVVSNDLYEELHNNTTKYLGCNVMYPKEGEPIIIPKDSPQHHSPKLFKFQKTKIPKTTARKRSKSPKSPEYNYGRNNFKNLKIFVYFLKGNLFEKHKNTTEYFIYHLI